MTPPNSTAATPIVEPDSPLQRGDHDLHRNILGNIPGAIWRFVQRPDGTFDILFASGGISGLWKGDEPDAALDVERVWQRIFAADLEAMSASVETSARNLTVWDHEWRIICDDGEIRWLHGIGRPQRTADGGTSWDTFLHDVTSRKIHEEHLSIALRSSRQGIVEWWPATNKLIISDSWTELTGYSADEMRYLKDLLNCGFIHPDDIDRVGETIAAIASGEVNELDIECRVRPKHGGTIWILGRGVMRERAESGAPLRVTGTIIDITKLKRVEDRLNMALGTARQGLWEWEPVADRLIPLSNWFEITGYDAHDFGSMQECYEQGVVHPDDSELVAQFLEALTRGDFDEGEIEFRIRKKSGEYFWALTRAAVTEKDDLGHALCIVGSNIDISERKGAEEQLRIAATAFESHGAIVIANPAGLILQVNSAFGEMMGYGTDEILGRDITVLRSARHEPPVYDAIAQSLNEHGRWDGEIWKRRRDGSEVPVWETITTVENDAGEVTHTVSNLLDISERLSAEEEVERLAFYDPLTTLPNRRYLGARIEEAIEVAVRRGRCGAVLFLDLDQFKKINDSMGHSAGDEVLVQVAKRLEGLIRHDDVVSRLGGDEFVILISDTGDDHAKSVEFVTRVADRIESELHRPFSVEGRELYITGTMGVSIFPRDGEPSSDFVRFADTAMYRGKAEGRNNVRFYHPLMVEHANERLELEQDLRTALDNDEFALHLQPQINAARGVIGAEALLRWNHPVRGLVPPDAFIPIAEESGLIDRIGRWVIEQAFAILGEWNNESACANLEHLSINVSSHQFRGNGFVEHIRATREQFDVPASRVVLELTERVVVEDIDNTAAKMAELRDLGFRFSLDDFGIGYSSLSYLRRLPLDQLKIDRSFVADVTRDTNADAIAQTIIAMGDHLGFDIIAEGVETEVQRNFLEQGGCTTFQGFLYCRPVPLDQFEAYCREEP